VHVVARQAALDAPQTWNPAYNRDSRPKPLLNDCWLVSAALQLVITSSCRRRFCCQKARIRRLDAAQSREA
jgi:hypothetical protein